MKKQLQRKFIKMNINKMNLLQDIKMSLLNFNFLMIYLNYLKDSIFE